MEWVFVSVWLFVRVAYFKTYQKAKLHQLTHSVIKTWSTRVMISSIAGLAVLLKWSHQKKKKNAKLKEKGKKMWQCRAECKRCRNWTGPNQATWTKTSKKACSALNYLGYREVHYGALQGSTVSLDCAMLVKKSAEKDRKCIVVELIELQGSGSTLMNKLETT